MKGLDESGPSTKEETPIPTLMTTTSPSPVALQTNSQGLTLTQQTLPNANLASTLRVELKPKLEPIA